ncbi:MAG TPA: GDP-fucose synthetase [Elusimicrobia bacterium]|nr:GDP-fucose synthetase [Elusimicrobiota bacterium]HBT61927.1 GDP-fucose synthetase [Elusimicrobiota bacterium]
MKSFWDGKKVLVTGGTGFVGSHAVEELLRRSPRARITVADKVLRPENLPGLSREVKLVRADLRCYDDCLRVCRGQDVVLNLSARVAGVGYNQAHHGTMFRDNMLLSLNMLEAARVRGVERFLVVSSACVYARSCPIPMAEADGFLDRPERTNEGYGWAKRMAEFQAAAYRCEFGMKLAVVRPINAYGPRDHFDREDCHVIAALIRRVVGGENPIRVWGDGTQTRSFLYVEDFARGLLDVTQRYCECDPVNLGSDEEVTIRDLAGMIRDGAGSRASLLFDAGRPAGQPRRFCSTAKAREAAGFSARIGLAEGLRRTIAWYRARERTA